MTRKHFEAIAAAMRKNKPASKAGLHVFQWVSDCEELADVFEQFNPNFDRQRFLDACKGE